MGRAVERNLEDGWEKEEKGMGGDSSMLKVRGKTKGSCVLHQGHLVLMMSSIAIKANALTD